MKFKRLKCPTCGANLAPDPNAELVACTYCHATSRVERPQSWFSTPAPAPASGGYYPTAVSYLPRQFLLVPLLGLIGMVPTCIATCSSRITASDPPGSIAPRQVRTAPPRQAKRPPVSESTGRSVPLVSLGNGSAPKNRQEPSLSVSSGRWRSSFCLVDANGDSALDVAGFYQAEGNHAQLTVVDGQNGAVIGSTGGFSGQTTTLPDLFCVSATWIGLADDTTLRVHVINARNPSDFASTILSDRLNAFGIGPDCVELESIDGEVVSMALSSRRNGPCSRRQPRSFRERHEDSAHIQRSITRRSVRTEANGVEVILRERNRGTEFFEIEARRGRRESWSVSTRLVRIGGGTGPLAIVSADQTVLALGSTLEDRRTGYAIGFNASTGAEQYRVRLGDRPAFRMRNLEYNGRWILLSEGWNEELIAFEPDSGTIAWRIGRAR